MRTSVWVPAALAAAAVAVAGTAAAQPAFTTAPHRNPPLLIDHHGEARKPLRIISFVPPGYPSATALQYFGNVIAQSAWLRAVARAYGFPAGAQAQGFQVNDMPKLGKASKAATYQTWVWHKLIALGIGPRPDLQTIFILYIPCTPPQSLDGYGCVSHHPKIVPRPTQIQFGSHDSLATVLATPSKTTDDRTRAATHELAEAVTDTGGGWYLRAANKHRPWLDSSPFVEDEGGGNIETADMSAGSSWRERFSSTTPPADHVYTYDRLYANRRSAKGGDPAVPASPEPYYNVSTAKDWTAIHAGSSQSVTLTGWSTRKIPAWTVSASMHAWEGSKSTPPAPASCTITGRTSWQLANGGTAKLTVKAAKGSKGTWCVVSVKSAAATTADGDLSHPWFVGFHVV